MKPSAQTSFAERLGQVLGRMWRACLRQERKVNGWLVAQGLPAGVSKVLLLAIKLVALGVLLYFAFWFVLLVGFVLLVVRGFAQNTQGEDVWAQKDELRHGEAGYGLYSSSGQRIDPHDPNNPYDQ